MACIVMAYTGMAYAVMAYAGTAYVAMAYIVMAYIVMACAVMVHVAMAYVVMASIVMAHIVMPCIVMAFIGMASIGLASIVMASIVMAVTAAGALPCSSHGAGRHVRASCTFPQKVSIYMSMSMHMYIHMSIRISEAVIFEYWHAHTRAMDLLSAMRRYGHQLFKSNPSQCSSTKSFKANGLGSAVVRVLSLFEANPTRQPGCRARVHGREGAAMPGYGSR